MTMTLPAFATLPEASRITGLGRTKLYELAAAGRISFKKVGSRTLVDVQSALDFIEAQPVAQLRPSRKASAGAAA